MRGSFDLGAMSGSGSADADARRRLRRFVVLAWNQLAKSVADCKHGVKHGSAVMARQVQRSKGRREGERDEPEAP
jgi:hypothetical protein